MAASTTGLAMSCLLDLLCENNIKTVKDTFFNNIDDEVYEHIMFYETFATKGKYKKAKVERYVVDVVSRYTDDDFKSHFRLSRSTVEDLMERLGPLHEVKTRGRPSLVGFSPDKQVLLSLWLIGNQESFRGVADRFGLSKGHAYREFVSFCEKLCLLRYDFISWPKGEEAVKVMEGFNTLRAKSFPNVIGCIDGAHIAITAPKVQKVAYVNRKRFTSVVLQAVCDHKMKFRDVFAGWPGSSHDARIFQNSPLFHLLMANTGMLPEGAHILGDGAYPLLPYLMVPYKDNGHLSKKQKHYNKILSSSRVVVEQAFGQLFARFRRLKYLLMFRLDRIPLVIVTGCILHNLCILRHDELPDISEDDDDIDMWDFQQRQAEHANVIPAERKRDEIANTIFY